MAVLYFLETWEGKDVGGRRVAEALLSTLGWELDANVALFDVDEICCCLLYSFFVVVVIVVYAIAIIRTDQQCAPLVRSVDSP